MSIISPPPPIYLIGEVRIYDFDLDRDTDTLFGVFDLTFFLDYYGGGLFIRSDLERDTDFFLKTGPNFLG